MNRKTLVILLVLPLLVFAADQAFTAFRSDGGDKKKDKQEQKMIQEPSQEAQAVQDEALEANPAIKNSEAVVKASKKMSQAELIREIVAEQDNINATYASLDYSEDMVWRGHESIAEATRKWLDKKLMAVMEKIDPMTLDLSESFGRCPSGYYYSILTEKDGKPTRSGWLIMEQGCDDQPMGLFRYDEAMTKVEVRVSDEAGYVPLKDYLRILKKINA